MLMAQYISKKRINLSRVSSRDGGKLASATVAGIEMIESIKASGAEDGYFEKWSGYQAAANRDAVNYFNMDTYLGIAPSLVSTVLQMLITFGSVYLCMKGEWTVGMITAYAGFLSSFLSPAMKLVGANQTLLEMRTSMERIEDVMEYPTDVEYADIAVDNDVEYDKLSGKIELKNVTFGYSRLAEPLIKDFSMTVMPGQHV